LPPYQGVKSKWGKSNNFLKMWKEVASMLKKDMRNGVDSMLEKETENGVASMLEKEM
jgi:hypothetical protein